MSKINYNKIFAIGGLVAIAIVVALTDPNEAIMGAIVGFVGGVLVTNGAIGK